MKESIRQRLIETKRRIVLEEVSTIFETEGFASVKMQDIAKRLEMSVGALYKLFESKEALYHAYVAHQIARFYEAYAQACEKENDPKVCLARYVKMKFDTFKQKRKALEESVHSDSLFFLKIHTRHIQSAQAIFTLLASFFARIDTNTPLKENDMLKTAYLFNAFSTGYVEYWLHHDTKLETNEKEIVESFLEGMIRSTKPHA